MNPHTAENIDAWATEASNALEHLRGHVPSPAHRPAIVALRDAIDDLPPVCRARGYLRGIADAPHIDRSDTR